MELAIILPFFFLVMGGIMTFGRWYLMKNRMVMICQYGTGLKKHAMAPHHIEARIREELSGRMWRSVRVRVQGVPLASFMPSTSQRVSMEVEFKPARFLRRLELKLLADQCTVTVDSWKYGVPRE